MPRDIASVMSQDRLQLELAWGLNSQEARIDVQMLLQRALGVSRAYLLAHPEQLLDATQRSTYDAMLQRRLLGEPIAHILGEREFFGLTLKVTPDTLIPRPDTELLVELALRRMPMEKGIRVLDLGTGSGAIALSIAHARPNVEVVAVDASAPALAVARENAQRLDVANVRYVQSDWFAALHGQSFDLIVSNPPYIAAGDVHLNQGDVRFEPLSALVSGADGLDDIQLIVGQAGGFLENRGWLLLEHGYDQGAAVRDLLQQSGLSEVFSAKDIAGIERVSGGMISR